MNKTLSGAANLQTLLPDNKATTTAMAEEWAAYFAAQQRATLALRGGERAPDGAAAFQDEMATLDEVL